MQRYRTVRRTVLGFAGLQDQSDVIIEPGAILESDGHTIWLIRDGCRFESITVGYAVELWLRDGIIERA